MTAKDRVYTKRLGGSVSLEDGVPVDGHLGDTWVLQEDVGIIGWFIDIHLGSPADGFSDADGGVSASNELTFAAARNKDAAFADIDLMLYRMHTGSPASGQGWIATGKESTVMLPAGKYIQALEGEEVNFFMQGNQTLGETTALYGEALIYYVKLK